MPLTRSLCWTFLAAAGFALAAATAPARQPAKDELPKRPATYGKVEELRRAGLPIPPDQVKPAKDAFAAYARYVADLISSPLTYKTSTEFNPDIRNPLPTPDTVISEHVTPRLLIPEPGNKVGPDQADYIREFAGAPPPAPTPEQQAVAAFVRRQAVRALAQVRYASINVPPGGPTVYPSHTLARVIYSDPALSPPPNPAEIAEATLGLCNMSPPAKASNSYNADAVADAVAT